MKKLTAQDMQKLSHKSQLKKHGGKKGLSEEMAKRVAKRKYRPVKFPDDRSFES